MLRFRTEGIDDSSDRSIKRWEVSIIEVDDCNGDGGDDGLHTVAPYSQITFGCDLIDCSNSQADNIGSSKVDTHILTIGSQASYLGKKKEIKENSKEYIGIVKLY